MINYILPAVLVAIVIPAVISSAKHFKGQGGCCGGGGELRPEKKKLSGPIVCKKAMVIDGMHCDNCRNRVERALNALDGVAGVVNLRKKTAVITAERRVSDEELTAAVTGAGYTVISVS